MTYDAKEESIPSSPSSSPSIQLKRGSDISNLKE
jgi:hypothetical protein